MSPNAGEWPPDTLEEWMTDPVPDNPAFLPFEELTASAQVHTGAMVALVPSAADATRLAVDGGEPVDQLHLTLMYLGEAGDYSVIARESIVERVESHPYTAPLIADAFAINAFNPGTASDRDPCIVMGVSGNDLARVHEWVNQALGYEREAKAPPQHEPWIPHVTLAYTDDLSRVAEFVDRVGPIVFDHVLVTFADDRYYIPLGAPAPDVAELDIPDVPMIEPALWPEGSFETIITVEGIETGDSRAFLPASLTVAPGPWLEFNWQPCLADGHDGAYLVGRLNEVWRTEDGSIRARGIFDVDGEYAQEPMRQVRAGFLKGVSVDLDSAVAEEFFDDPMSDRPTFTLFHSARIRGATLVTYPAYVETQIWMTEGTPMAPIEAGPLIASGEPVTPEAVTACGCDTAYTPPDDDVFADPKFTGVAPITVTDDGRVFGHGAAWGTCHTGVQGTCRVAPREGEHAYFRLGEVVTASGASVPVGHITMGIGHAPTEGFGAAAAMEHYDNTKAVIADVASGEDAYGIWFAGKIRPGVTDEQKAALRSATLSGDWRSFGGKLRLVAMLAVNVPGFPVPRLSTTTSGGRQLSLVAAGIVSSNAGSVVMSSLQRRIGRDPAARRVALVGRVHGTDGTE
jgi:2'-5' RNA ligase